ncbi:Sfum_1244 family protein [Thioalkalivibrio paradoxus]|uniref:Uncharacterized protein n=1 Tax=Thioalkalivibrio paradoxus ARh 1 TaxID=713585 RepID=W0DPS3_9GAMM|nr:Sfum_1244 family protein [Thioalkalivibrio paradoxus]AHE98865.1 hypothetical protein THITH_12055 [Thioalkalivibrio paradoxus ARh 1]
MTQATFESVLSGDGLSELRAAVQRNCDIADAEHAGNYSLCTYLLKMREFYRWERRLPFSAALNHQEVGDWVSQREQGWEQLEGLAPEALPLGATRHDPFDQDAVNRRLDPHGLVYGAGYGRGARPLFFLGALLRREDFDDYRVYIVGEESARDLAAPPAMSRGNLIFVRRESVRRLLFETVEAWQMRGAPADDPLARALRAYGFDAADPATLERMTDSEVEAAVWHEVGEVLAGQRLGPAWQQRVLEVAGSRGEVVARAVRDHLADCLTTLPALLEDGADGAIHFYFANLTGMRALLFPQLRDAYDRWVAGAPLAVLKAQVAPAREHWLAVARRFLEESPDGWPVEDDRLAELQPNLRVRT